MKASKLQSTVLTVTLTVVAVAIGALTNSTSHLYGRVLQQNAIPQNAIVINLDGRGALQVNQEQIEPSRLTDRIRDIAATRNQDTAVIVAAATVSFKEVVGSMEAVRAAGIEQVGILKSDANGSIRESLPPVGSTVLIVDRSGAVRLDGRRIKLAQVSTQLQRAFKRRNDHTVYIQAYGALSFDIVGNVIDAAKAAGAKPIGLVASNN
jgi:biopolymer transport protein ExbD